MNSSTATSALTAFLFAEAFGVLAGGVLADQAFGCTLHERHPIYWTDVTTLSFFPAKPLGCYGDGGAILVKDDLVKIKIRDVVAGPEIRTRAIVVQQKTGRPVQFEITSDVRASLLAWLERRGGSVDDYVFPSRVDHTRHMSTRQYGRLVDEWVTAIGLRREEYGTHSMRRTKASMIYRATGNIRAIQILLGHSKIENTVRYLGVDVEDALLLAERTEI